MAMLFITHDLGIVRKIADDVAVMQKGKIVETGKMAEIFAAPAPSLHASADRRRTERRAARRSMRAAKTILEASDIRVWFPIKRGFFRRTVGYVKAVDGVSRVRARRRDARRCRRIRLRQNDARPRPPAAHPQRGRDRLSRPQHRGSQFQGDAAAAARHADRLSRPLRFSVAPAVRRRYRRRRPWRAI